MKEFFMSFFNLDSRFFQTMGNIFIPAKLTNKYIEGKRKSYINPARLFLFSMIFFFAVINYAVKNNDFNFDNMEKLKSYATQKKQVAAYDSLLMDIKIDSTAADTIRKRLFPNIKKNSQDSITIAEAEGFIQVGSLGGKKYYIGDIANMDEDKFIEHYKIEGFTERLLTRQVLRVNRNPKAVSTFMIGNMLWAVVLSVFFLAFIMKLLYIRGKRFYVEHLILQMHIHSFIFMVVGILVLGYALGWIDQDIALGIGIVLVLPFIFFSFKRYYKQGYIKTFFKTILLGISYFFITLVCSILIMLISMVVF